MSYNYSACRRGTCVGTMSVVASLITIVGGWCLVGFMIDINNRMPFAANRNIVEYYPPWVGATLQYLNCSTPTQSTNCFEFANEPVPFMPPFVNLGRQYTMDRPLGTTDLALIVPSVALSVVALFVVYPDKNDTWDYYCVAIVVQHLVFLWFVGLAATSLWFWTLHDTIDLTHNVSWYSNMDSFTIKTRTPIRNTICVKIAADEYACTGSIDRFFQLTPGFANILDQLGVSTDELCRTSFPVPVICGIVFSTIAIYYGAWILWNVCKAYGCERNTSK